MTNAINPEKVYEKSKVANLVSEKIRWEHEAYTTLIQEFGCPIKIIYHWSEADMMNTVDLVARARAMTTEEVRLEMKGHAAP